MPKFGLLKYAGRPQLVTSCGPENLENPEKLRYRGGLSGDNPDNRTVSNRAEVIHCQNWRAIPDIRGWNATTGMLLTRMCYSKHCGVDNGRGGQPARGKMISCTDMYKLGMTVTGC